ncbi:MAG: LPP20 family lipoprotein, partial [Myxococcota bacterium]
MRRSIVICGVLLLTLTSCGGKKGGKSAHAAPSPKDVFGETADGRPGWLTRGSVAVTTVDGRRMFFGVGIASGIRNPSLLRSTADNRARAELGKVFEVYSASLMKDYMASTGEQNVEQAIKTMSSVSLKGVEIPDRYISDDGNMYALAQLDLQRAMDAVRAAEAMGAVKSHVTKVTTDDIFDKHSKKPPPPREQPPAKVADGSAPLAAAGAPEAPPPTDDPPRTGKRPDWIDTADPRFPNSKYLCGVGFSPDRAIAESGAYAALSRIFVARVSSVSRDFMGAYSKTGAKPLEIQSAESLTKITTGKVFSGVRIYEVYKDEDGTYYGLACMDRQQAGQALREQIAAADGRAGKQLDKASRADKASKLRYLGRAMDAIVERVALNGELRIVEASGIGVAGPYSHVDVASALEEAQEALKVGVVVTGAYIKDFRTAFIESLAKRGYHILDDPKGADVLVEVTVRLEDEGEGRSASGKAFFNVRAKVLVEITNPEKNEVITTLEASKKQGRRTKKEAELRAVRFLAKNVVKKVGAKIDNA